MERMMDLEEMLRELSEKYKNSKSVEVYEEDLEGWFKIIDDLREENKKLNIIIENTKIEQEADRKHIEELEEENKKLKERVSELEDVSEDYDLLSKDFITLGEENERLKSDLGECECSFGFESDEVGFWKREYKRLKKWIKDHCKGYGNLFPEDEMKRQWKKADKKRK